MSVSCPLTNNIANSCRICLRIQSQMNSFFSACFEGLSLADIFTNITSYQIKENDWFPKNICADCENSIISFNNTISVFQETEATLKKKIANEEVKDEIETEDNVDTIENDLNDIEDDLMTEEVKSEGLEDNDIAKIKEIEKKWKNETISGNSEYKFTLSHKYTCDCGDCFLHKSGFRQHMQSKHNKYIEDPDLDKYSEEIRLKIPIGFPNNMEYVFSKGALKKNKLQCRICNTTFLTEQEVKTHEEVHKTFICHHCGSAFLKKHYLTDHIRIHSKEYNYTCKVCEKAFKHRYSYNVHKKSHNVVRNFVCDTCGAAFKTSHTLRTHFRIKHSDIRNYPCPECDLKFNLRSTLNKHMSRRHTPDRKKSFVCTECGAAYLNKNTLTRHVGEKHLGKAQYYPCTICENRVFAQKKSLRAHILKKHDVTPE